jgi:hypothetical protein
MNKHILIAFFVLILVGCNKANHSDDPCNQLVDGIYQYPTEDPNPSLTSAQKIEYWNIPEDVLPCFMTDGLVETCLNYHNLGAILFLYGTNGIQDGYDLAKERCRGFLELENRTDAFDSLIKKYKSIDTINFITDTNPLEYGGYNFYTYSLEVIIGQEKILQNTTDKQEIELLTELFVKQDYRKKFRSYYSIEGTTFVMGRIMYFNNYLPLMNECKNNNIMNSFILKGNPIQRADIISAINSFANDYLALLKTR